MNSGHRDHLPQDKEVLNKTFGHGGRQAATPEELKQTAKGQGKRVKANAKSARAGKR
jgi:hypothetical protein